MNSIKNWIKAKNIHLGLKAHSELSTLRMMIKLGMDDPAVRDKPAFAAAIVDTEIYDSAIQGCCNISFYAETEAVDAPLFVFGRFDQGMGYFSKKNKPVDLVSLVAVPPGQDKNLGDTLIKLHTLLCQPQVAEKIRLATSKREIYRVFMENPD